MWFFLPVGKFFKNILSVCVPTHTVNRRLVDPRSAQGESNASCHNTCLAVIPSMREYGVLYPVSILHRYLCGRKANQYCLNVWPALYLSTTSLMHEVRARARVHLYMRGDQALEPKPNAMPTLARNRNHITWDMPERQTLSQ